MARSRKAIEACAAWLAYCLKIGWKKSSLDELETLWWTHHDDHGKLMQLPRRS
jgi:hypothetical protein